MGDQKGGRDGASNHASCFELTRFGSPGETGDPHAQHRSARIEQEFAQLWTEEADVQCA